MILERLKRMEGFTHQERAVARYILDHMEEISQMSAEGLARASTPARPRSSGFARSLKQRAIRS